MVQTMMKTRKALASSPKPLRDMPNSERACQYTKKEWEGQKPFIVGTYQLKGMTLSKIEEMLHERGFFAK